MLKIKNYFIAVICFVLFFNLSVFANKSKNFSTNQVKDIENIIHNYLVNHPEVLVEASVSLQKKRDKDNKLKTIKLIKKFSNELFHNRTNKSVGNKNGNIVIFDFFDYQCPHCHAVDPVLFKLIKLNKNIKLIFNSVPAFGKGSLLAVKASYAAIKQGKYVQLHRALLKHGYPLNEKNILHIAKSVGIDIKTMNKDMNSSAANNFVKHNEKFASDVQLGYVPLIAIKNIKSGRYNMLSGQVDLNDLQNAIKKI